MFFIYLQKRCVKVAHRIQDCLVPEFAEVSCTWTKCDQGHYVNFSIETFQMQIIHLTLYPSYVLITNWNIFNFDTWHTDA